MEASPPTRPTTRPGIRLDGLNVLVVEDSYLVAESLAHVLTEAGATVVGPVPRADEARRLIDAHRIDAALLDVKLAVGDTVPIARVLQDRGKPFLFVTGYGSPALPDELFANVPILNKPVARLELLNALHRLIADPPAVGHDA